MFGLIEEALTTDRPSRCEDDDIATPRTQSSCTRRVCLCLLGWPIASADLNGHRKFSWHRDKQERSVYVYRNGDEAWNASDHLVR